MSDWLNFIVFALFAFFLLSQLLLIVRTMYIGLRSRTWPQVPGHVVTAEIRKVQGTSPITPMRYQAILEYEYQVNGNIFRSGNISIGDAVMNKLHQGLRSKRVAEKIVQMYPFYSAVNIYYDPQNPARAVLKPGISSTNLIIWLFTLIIPILMVVLAWLLSLR